MPKISHFDRMCASFLARKLRDELEGLEESGGVGTVFGIMGVTFCRSDVKRLEAVMRRRLAYYEKRASIESETQS
jgi:hypothetical protein